jgi:LDH2 family malate/lactate/ureidoglycolate dehydrogenase
MPRFSAETLRHSSRVILEAAGTNKEAAQVVGESLVEANLVGHDSHGFIRLLSYVEQVRSGQVKPAAVSTVASRHGAAAQVDGAWGWGQPAARLATETAVALASQRGVGAVTIGRCNHIGRLGEYVHTLARAQMVGIAFCNADPTVAAFGGRTRVLGTNPIAWAVPRDAGSEPLVHDFATAGVAEGKVRVARLLGNEMGPGLILDRSGKPSRSPADFYEGGALLPFGEHKGYGLSVMIEVTAGVLSGMAASALPEYRGANGTLILALDIASFMPFEEYVDQVERLCSVIQASPPADGFDRVRLPGEIEAETRSTRLLEGIDVAERTWEDVQSLAAQLQVAL